MGLNCLKKQKVRIVKNPGALGSQNASLRDSQKSLNHFPLCLEVLGTV